MVVKVISSCSIKAFRYRVHALEQDLWKELDPVSRANLALQLADAATTLARLEMQEAQRLQQSSLVQELGKECVSARLYQGQESGQESLPDCLYENPENC